jgi:hypothetical protein
MIEPQITVASSQRLFGKGFSGTAPENYERYFVPAIGAPFAADLVELAAFSSGSAFWTWRAGRASSHALRRLASGPQEA